MPSLTLPPRTAVHLNTATSLCNPPPRARSLAHRSKHSRLRCPTSNLSISRVARSGGTRTGHRGPCGGSGASRSQGSEKLPPSHPPGAGKYLLAPRAACSGLLAFLGSTGALLRLLLLALLRAGLDWLTCSRLPVTAGGGARYSCRWVGGQGERPGDCCGWGRGKVSARGRRASACFRRVHGERCTRNARVSMV